VFKSVPGCIDGIPGRYGMFRGIMGCSRGGPGLFRAVLGCSGGVPGMFRGVPGVFRGVPGCSGAVPGFTDTLLMLSTLITVSQRRQLPAQILAKGLHFPVLPKMSIIVLH